MEDDCFIHVEDPGGVVKVTSIDENRVIFDPTPADEARLHAVLPFVSSGTYPMRIRGRVTGEGDDMILFISQDSAVYEVFIAGTVRSIKVSWPD